MIAALNMTDIAKKTGLITDAKLLELQLRCPVIPICARKRKGIDNLKKQLEALKKQGEDEYSPKVGRQIKKAEKKLKEAA